jgi:hypothetical protein
MERHDIALSEYRVERDAANAHVGSALVLANPTLIPRPIASWVTRRAMAPWPMSPICDPERSRGGGNVAIKEPADRCHAPDLVRSRASKSFLRNEKMSATTCSATDVVHQSRTFDTQTSNRSHASMSTMSWPVAATAMRRNLESRARVSCFIDSPQIFDRQG